MSLPYCPKHSARSSSLLLALLLGSFSLATDTASAQSSYVYHPTASPTDGHFLTITGTGIQTLVDSTVTLKIGSSATSVEIGIFDGETGGKWDQDTISLIYTLYADPAGNGTGTVEVAKWHGYSMTDNGWSSYTVTNTASAQSSNGNYFYALRVRSSNPAVRSWSNFKVRTNGTLALMRGRPFAYTAPINNADAAIIYPRMVTHPSSGPFDSTTYTGVWNFYLDVPAPIGQLTVWDGDMDHGNYNGTNQDTDDSNTPNDVLPAWTPGTDAVYEGVAKGTPIIGSLGDTTGYLTGFPNDNHQTAVIARNPAVEYEIIDPNGTVYSNSNPSGNREWEMFRIDTAALNTSIMDHHATSLPTGIYTVRIKGVDMNNLNAWYFNHDALGVDASGQPVLPIRPTYMQEGVVFYDANENGLQDPGEPGIPSVTMECRADYDDNGTTDYMTTTVTDVNGRYKVSGLYAGKYTVCPDMSTLADDVVAIADFDGATTANTASLVISATQTKQAVNFAYKRTNPPGTGTRGYWVNHPENWPVDELTLGCSTYTKAQCIKILQQATKGDNSYSMAAQLIAAKLNLYNGNEAECITATVTSAMEWLCSHPIGSKPSKSAWTSGEPHHKKLDDYNNGRLCAEHID